MDLRQFLAILRARWKFIVGTFLVGIFLTVGLLLQLSPTYTSSARLFISTSGQVDPNSTTLFTAQRVASYANLALDPAVLDRVIDRLGLNISRSQLAGQIKATVVPSTLIIQLDTKASSPQLAQQIAAAEADEVIVLVKGIEKPSSSTAGPVIDARVAGKASFNAKAVSPDVPLDLVIGIMLSLFVGVAGAVLRDLLDTTVKSREDVERSTGAAVMATLPFDPSVRKQPLPSEDGSNGSLSEAFRVLRTNLQFANLDALRQMIVVSSAVANEGKTLVATNLAISMAKSGRSVLLIDADMRNPGVADLLSLENSVGVITVLIGRATVEQATQVHSSGIRFLGTGPRPPNPAEVLDTQAMRDLLASLRAQYDVIIIDAPPMLPVADASILATEVDGTLLLARYGSTANDQLKLAVARIEAVGGRLFGTVLNRTPRRANSDYGYYGYGYGTLDEPLIASQNSGPLLGRAGRRAKR